MAQAGLTVRRTCRADAKAEPSEPTVGVRRRGRLSDKSYSRDNRLVPPKSSYRRRSSAPRCRLTPSWGWRSSQRFGCSPIKVVRELGSDRSLRDVCHTMDSLNHFESLKSFLSYKIVGNVINLFMAVYYSNVIRSSRLISVEPEKYGQYRGKIMNS